MMDIKSAIHFLWQVNGIDIDALEDARMTLESIKDADPGTYDEIIDESLRLISKALKLQIGGAIEVIEKQLEAQKAGA
jgi:hypothetical protein